MRNKAMDEDDIELIPEVENPFFEGIGIFLS